jgi:endonuclease/exonuclease/phosphatase family metal-dependent hydrolase
VKLKILNLNLWNYNSWEERKPKIIKFIKKENPDVVVFQEVRDDLQFNKNGDHQVKQLNEELNYPHLLFYSATDKRKERPEKYKLPCKEGTAVLSKYPLSKVEKKMLKKQKDDRYHCGNLYFRLKKQGKNFDFVAVHFSPHGLFSKLHLEETLNDIKKKKVNPIIMGDFNIIKSGILHNSIKGKFESSLQYKKYISYPKGNFTLDYIVIPKNMKFKTFKCVGKGLSDHKALVAEVMLK